MKILYNDSVDINYPCKNFMSQDKTTIYFSAIAIIVSVISVYINWYFITRRLPIMMKELEIKLFAGIEINLLEIPYLFNPRSRFFPLRITKNGQGIVTNIGFSIFEQNSKDIIPVKLIQPTSFSNSNVLDIDIFPELDALLIKKGLYGPSRQKPLKNAPYYFCAKCSWVTVGNVPLEIIYCFRIRVNNSSASLEYEIMPEKQI